MIESSGQTPHDLEAELLPEVNGGFVGGGDEVELHGFVAEFFGDLLGVQAHGGGQASASGGGSDHIAAVADMRSLTGVVGLDVVGSQDGSVLCQNKGLSRTLHPDLSGLIFVCISGIGVGLSGSDYFMENRPNFFKVFLVGFSDGHEKIYLWFLSESMISHRQKKK